MEAVALLIVVAAVGAAFASVTAAGGKRGASGSRAQAGPPLDGLPVVGEPILFDEEEATAVNAALSSALAESGLRPALGAPRLDEGTRPFAVKALAIVARARLDRGQSREAALTCLKMIGLCRDSFQAWHLLAEAYDAQGDPVRAGKCVDQALTSLEKPGADPSAPSWSRPIRRGEDGPSLAVKLYAAQMGAHWDRIAGALQRVQRHLLDVENGGSRWNRVLGCLIQLGDVHRAMSATRVPAELSQVHAAALEVTAPFDRPYNELIRAVESTEGRRSLPALVDQALGRIAMCSIQFASCIGERAAA